MTIGMRFYTGTEHLVFKVMADSYKSDPDVFISKTNAQPNSSKNAEWFCVRDGSETCVIHNGQFAVGDTLYIGVKCVEECSYKLRPWFTNLMDLAESERTQMRFEAYST